MGVGCLARFGGSSEVTGRVPRDRAKYREWHLGRPLSRCGCTRSGILPPRREKQNRGHEYQRNQGSHGDLRCRWCVLRRLRFRSDLLRQSPRSFSSGTALRTQFVRIPSRHDRIRLSTQKLAVSRGHHLLSPNQSIEENPQCIQKAL